MIENHNSNYGRALAASGHLRALDRTIRLLCALAPKTEPFCAGCIWEDILKPLATPLVGWSRNRPLAAHEPSEPWQAVRLVDLVKEPRPRFAAGNPAEAWLRTEEAWDAVTDEWLRLLNAADPAQGHGYPASVTAGVSR